MRPTVWALKLDDCYVEIGKLRAENEELKDKLEAAMMGKLFGQCPDCEEMRRECITLTEQLQRLHSDAERLTVYIDNQPCVCSSTNPDHICDRCYTLEVWRDKYGKGGE